MSRRWCSEWAEYGSQKEQIVKNLTCFNEKLTVVMWSAEIFWDDRLIVEEHFKTNFNLMGVVGTHSPVASLFGWFYMAKQWKLPMLRGFPGPFPGADSFKRLLRICPNIDGMGSNQFCSCPGLMEDTRNLPDLYAFLTNKPYNEVLGAAQLIKLDIHLIV